MGKNKAIQRAEEETMATQFRIGELRALVQEMGEGEVPIDLRLTGAEIAWIRLVGIAKNGADSVAVQAANIILERTYGKAIQKAEIKGDGKLTIVVQ